MTYDLCCQPETWPPLQEAARRRGDCFSRQRFEAEVWQLFGPIEEEYGQVQLPDPAQMAKRPTLLRELRD